MFSSLMPWVKNLNLTPSLFKIDLLGGSKEQTFVTGLIINLNIEDTCRSQSTSASKNLWRPQHSLWVAGEGEAAARSAGTG